MHSQAGPLGGDPRREPLAGQRPDGVRAQQPLVVEAAQPATGDVLAVAAGDPALVSAPQRPGPGDERRDGLGAVLAPAALVPEAQPRAVQVTFAAGHRATLREQRPPHAGRRCGVELIPAGPGRTRARRHPSQRPDGRRVPVGHRGVRHGHAEVRGDARSPVNSSDPPSHSPGRHAGSSRACSHSSQSGRPDGVAAGARPGGLVASSAGLGHRYCFPAATASTAWRLSSSRACR